MVRHECSFLGADFLPGLWVRNYFWSRNLVTYQGLVHLSEKRIYGTKVVRLIIVEYHGSDIFYVVLRARLILGKLYSSVTQNEELSPSEINVHGGIDTAMAVLSQILSRASASASHFDWTRYVHPLNQTMPHSQLEINPYGMVQGDCSFGCLGWLCDTMDSCQPGSVCKNNVCEPCSLGCPGMDCNSKKPCQEWTKCVDGICQECSARSTSSNLFKSCNANPICSNDALLTARVCNYCNERTSKCRGSPCIRASDCNADEECDFGTCKSCTTSGCLGQACQSSVECKTGLCNFYKKCDYPSVVNRSPHNPGEDRGVRRAPGRYGPSVSGGPTRPTEHALIDIKDPRSASRTPNPVSTR